MRALVIESDNGIGDTLTLSAPMNQRCEIEIDEPWSGDTESGFGHISQWSLTVEQAKLVRDHLDAFIRNVEGEGEA